MAERERFQYQQRGREDWKSRATQKTGLFDPIFFDEFAAFLPKEGNHTIRFLPPTWKEPKHYGLDIFVHYGIGPDNQSYLCAKAMGKGDCPICEERKLAERANDAEYMKELGATKRCLVWIINRAEEADGPVLWSVPVTLDKEICRLAEDRHTGRYLNLDDPEEGYDVDFTREGSGRKTKYVAVQVARRDSPLCRDVESMEEWLAYVEKHPLPTVLQFFEPDYIAGMFAGAEERQEDNDRERDIDAMPDKHQPRGREENDDTQEENLARRGLEKRYREDEPDEDQPRRRPRYDDVDREEEEPRRPLRDEEIPFDEEKERKPAPRQRLESRPTTSQRESDEDEPDDAPLDFKSRLGRGRRAGGR